MPTKTMYHSVARALGPVRVTVKSDVMQSKFPGKPEYVCLEIAGVDWNYNLESPTCGDVFQGQKGNTFSVIFEGGGKGKEDSATVTYVGEAAEEAAPARPAPPAPAPRKQSMPPHNTSVPASHPAHVTPQARPAAPAAPAQARAQFVGHPGARVGACLNKAVDYMIAEGINSSDPAFSQTLYNLVSDMVRVAAAIEDGHLAPKQSERAAQ